MIFEEFAIFPPATRLPSVGQGSRAGNFQFLIFNA